MLGFCRLLFGHLCRCNQSSIVVYLPAKPLGFDLRRPLRPQPHIMIAMFSRHSGKRCTLCFLIFSLLHFSRLFNKTKTTEIKPPPNPW